MYLNLINITSKNNEYKNISAEVYDIDEMSKYEVLNKRGVWNHKFYL